MASSETLVYDVVNYYKPGTVNQGQTSNFLCVVHGHDVRPSARIYPESKLYKCYACGFFGGPVRLVRTIENLKSDREAKDLIFREFGIKLTESEEVTERSVLYAYKEAIEELVISTRHPKFNRIYFDVDYALFEGNEERLKEIYDGIVRYSAGALASSAAEVEKGPEKI